MTRSAFFILAILAASGARAQEPAARREPEHPRGAFTHGDSGDIVEEFYGGRVEPAPRETGAAAKGDPGIRWGGPGAGR